MLNLRRIGWSCLTLVILGGPTSAAERVPGPPKISITPPKLPSVTRLPPPKSPSPTTTGPTSGGVRVPTGDRPSQPAVRPVTPGRALRDPASITLPTLPVTPAASPRSTEPAASPTLTRAISGGGGLEGAVVRGGGGLSSAVTSQP